MIIELYGLPGTGKTTFANRLTKDIPKGIKVKFKNKLDVIFYFMLGLFVHPVSFYSGYVFCISNNKSLYNFWNFYIFRYAKFYKAERMSKKYRLVIVDEGPLQNVLSFYEWSHQGRSLEDIINTMPKADLIIIFDISSKVRELQLKQKQGQTRQPEIIKKMEFLDSQFKNSFVNEKTLHYQNDYSYRSIVDRILMADSLE